MKSTIVIILSISLALTSCNIRKYKSQALYSKNKQMYWVDWENKFPQECHEHQKPKRISSQN